MAGEVKNQADVVAELDAANKQLAAITATGKTAAVLVSEHATATAQVTALTGDKTKLVAGATVPTDLVTAANQIFNLTVERDNLKAKETTIEKSVAAEVAKLGITPGAKSGASEAGKATDKPLTATEKVLKANGVKDLAELGTKKQKARDERGI